MNIIIVGGGKVGSTLVEQLAKEGHDITIIDQDYKIVEELTNTYDAMGVVGNGASYGILSEAGIEKADLFIAVTGQDELNLLCCTVAKRVGNLAAIAMVSNCPVAHLIIFGNLYLNHVYLAIGKCRYIKCHRQSKYL